MKLWWRREIDEARESADQAERQQQFAAESTARMADAAVERAKKVGSQLRDELVQNGFAEALRTAFGGVG
ncbi:DUF7620 family protein [Mycolicibacterium fluoranthenivorans]|uniref:Uncharacterized protein n=1 Tax=Mycolicibacterium fluoranthenivorans TaxID=258505 RepID=A0A7X5ZG38_9MYCO|nr:hypothetical protein [Mycolicibacterium fluoranthenivorans]MCV7354517.1 hypothetical protein [Mycolicibacterium fluoranthenivorans]NIH98876.1 hypothetical protein [Mycolicibacterium fluoranthenivorans]